jgi:hypothetical protein
VTGRDHRGKKRKQTIDDISTGSEALKAQPEAVLRGIVVRNVLGEHV